MSNCRGKRTRYSEEHIEKHNQGYINVSTSYFLKIRKNRDVIIARELQDNWENRKLYGRICAIFSAKTRNKNNLTLYTTILNLWEILNILIPNMSACKVCAFINKPHHFSAKIDQIIS